MSYEGSEEYLCVNGHYWIQDCYESEPKECPRCGAPMAYFHGIDETNGYDPQYPNTYPAGKAIVGVEDDWNNDPYGNRYVTQTHCYAPAPGSEWRSLKR